MSNTLSPPPRAAKPKGRLAPSPFAPVGAPTGYKMVIYGTGGVGKTTLAAHAPGPVVMFDLENSLPILKRHSPCDALDAIRTAPATTWQEVRDLLAAPVWDGVKTIGIDSASRLEEMAAIHTMETVKTEKGKVAASIEDYGYGKGYGHVFDTFIQILADLEQHAMAGRNVIIIAHECAERVPNPGGEDYLQYQPRLQNPSSGKSSIRLKLKEWCDSMSFIAYDIAVEKDSSKAKGGGTRTLYPDQLAHCMGKCRMWHEPIYLDNNNLSSVWTKLIGE